VHFSFMVKSFVLLTQLSQLLAIERAKL